MIPGSLASAEAIAHINHDTGIRNGQPAVPPGAGMSAARAEAVPAYHVQLGAAGSGGASTAGVRRATPAAGEARGAPRRRNHPPGAPRAWEKGPDQELYVAVPDGPGRWSVHRALQAPAQPERIARGETSGGLFRVFPRGRLPGLPQAAEKSTASPAKRVAVGKEKQGSERNFRRRRKRS